MQSRPNELIMLRKDQIKPASRMLDRAFRDDPVTRYAFGADIASERPYAYEFLLRYYFGQALIYTPSERLEGIAIWQRYPLAKLSFWHSITSGAIWPALRTGTGAGNRMRVLEKYMEQKHAELVPAPHWYLAMLGVDPQFQGQGYASLLLNSMLARIDEEQLPCFLETTKAKNVPLYQHFGFNVIAEYVLPDSAVKFWGMLREHGGTNS